MAQKLGLNRILKEIKEVNRQFQNLRTYIVPDPKHERADLFYFVMYPADGSLADRPIVGKMFLRTGLATYPEYPPIVHVFTKTKRFNVDIFNRGDESFLESSSMCFDILNKKGSYGEGIWEKDFTLSAVFASLLQVLVEYKVQQQYSHNFEITEAVSMQKMATQHAEIDKVWSKYKSYFTDCPKIIRTKAKKIAVNRQIEFQSNKIFVSCRKSSRIHSSYPFLLDNADFSVVVDLTDFRNKLTLEKHLYNFVVSIVLSNSPRDPFGRQDSTILVRDGITGTAAKKLAGQDMRWFYHGRPLTDFQKIRVTVSHKQITLVVEKAHQREQDALIFGDTVLSYLTEAELGSCINDRDFYLLVYVETKSNLEFLTDREEEELLRDPICIRLVTDTQYGYIHPSERYKNNKGAESNALIARQVKLLDQSSSITAQIVSDDQIAPVNHEVREKPSDQLIMEPSATTGPKRLEVELSRMVICDNSHYFYLTSVINSHKNPWSVKNISQSQADASKSSTYVRLDGRLISYLEIFLSEWESANRKSIKAALNQINSESLHDKLNSMLRIDDAKPESEPSSPSNSLTESVSLNSSGLASSIESLDLDNVAKVSIYMSKSSNLMYRDILGSQDMLHLLNSYEKVINPGHIVLCHRNDFFYHEEFSAFLKNNYIEDQIVEFQVKGVAFDQVGLVLLIDTDESQPKTRFVQNKYRMNLVATVAINGNSPLAYGNSMADKALNSSKKSKAEKDSVTVKYFDEPIKCLGQIKFHRKAKC